MLTTRQTALLTQLLAFAVGSPLSAQVSRIEIQRREPFANGYSFPHTGPYEKIVGSLYLEADPASPANARVADLGRAPKNAAGRVEFRTDFYLLKPVDPTRGNRRLFYDVNNRGHKIATGSFNGRGGNDPTTLEDAGDGFLMRQGYAILWTGWSGDVRPGEGRLTIDLPIAREGERSITGRVYTELEPSVTQLFLRNRPGGGTGADPTQPLPSHPFVWADTRPYPVVSLDNRTATLTKRQRRTDPPIEIPRSQWRFARWEDGKVVPDSTSVYLEGGFRPGWLYDLIYTARDPRVSGLGFVGVRDAIAFFRYADRDRRGTANPLAGAVDRVLGFGGSQSGRFLNHFVFEGFNDAEGKPVFDGIIAHVPGAGKGQFNYRFAQTTRHGSHHEEKLYPSDFFPFTSVSETDPLTGATGDNLARARAAGPVPKIFYTQTSTEYWSRAASLLHTDVEGTQDLPLDPNVRIYLFTGGAHNAMTGGRYAHELNRFDTRPLLRALLVALDRWASGDGEPPPSRYPTIADGTLIDIERFRATFPKIPGAVLPAEYYAPYRLDPGPRWFTEGIADNVPPKAGPPYRTLVPAVDADGNEVAGVRLPEHAVPLGTYAGWNLRAAAWGAEGMLTRWMGSAWPFPADPAERSKNEDPRLSVVERYPSRAAYLAKITDAALALHRQRLLLDEDVVAILKRAAAAGTWKD